MEVNFKVVSAYPLHQTRLACISSFYLKFTGAKQKITEIKEMRLQWLQLWQRCTNSDVTPLRPPLSSLPARSAAITAFLNGDGVSRDKWLCIPLGQSGRGERGPHQGRKNVDGKVNTIAARNVACCDICRRDS
jgi:hypothetical protein